MSDTLRSAKQTYRERLKDTETLRRRAGATGEYSQLLLKEAITARRYVRLLEEALERAYAQRVQADAATERMLRSFFRASQENSMTEFPENTAESSLPFRFKEGIVERKLTGDNFLMRVDCYYDETVEANPPLFYNVTDIVGPVHFNMSRAYMHGTPFDMMRTFSTSLTTQDTFDMDLITQGFNDNEYQWVFLKEDRAYDETA